MPHFLRFVSCHWLKALIKAFPLTAVLSRPLLPMGSLTSMNKMAFQWFGHFMLLHLYLLFCVGQLPLTFNFKILIQLSKSFEIEKLQREDRHRAWSHSKVSFSSNLELRAVLKKTVLRWPVTMKLDWKYRKELSEKCLRRMNIILPGEAMLKEYAQISGRHEVTVCSIILSQRRLIIAFLNR